MIDYMNIEDINKVPRGCFKFVIVNGQLRFVDVMRGSHCEIVGPTEQASDAGTLAVQDHYCRILETGSITLNMRDLSEEGENLLKNSLNRPLKDRYDY